MKEKLIKQIEDEMLNVLNNAQLMYLEKVLERNMNGLEVTKVKEEGLYFKYDNNQFIEMFLRAKKIEGCSIKTINNYRLILNNALNDCDLNVTELDTDYWRNYLSKYKEERNCKSSTLDNIRRVVSSFYIWLQEENYILKSPMIRIHKIKTKKVIKEIYSDEMMEKLREHTNNPRDLAIIDLLASTGMRIGEMLKLNISDIDFENRECIVSGKGNKERLAYLDAKAKVHLKEYLETRKDENPALFVSLDKPYNRLGSSGIQYRLRVLGRSIGIEKVHPHRFRRTMATRAIDKGMPIEQVQSLLGHSQIETTLRYALVNQNNVKQSHKKYIA